MKKTKKQKQQQQQQQQKLEKREKSLQNSNSVHLAYQKNNLDI